MKYLNKNIEEIGKKANEKSLINFSSPCGIFKNYDCNNPILKKAIQINRTY